MSCWVDGEVDDERRVEVEMFKMDLMPRLQVKLMWRAPLDSRATRTIAARA